MNAHGTRNTYTKGCRCVLCRSANTTYANQRKHQRPPLQPDDPRHGTPNGYGNWNCRCDQCRAANTADLKARGPIARMRAMYEAQGLTQRGTQRIRNIAGQSTQVNGV